MSKKTANKIAKVCREYLFKAETLNNREDKKEVMDRFLDDKEIETGVKASFVKTILNKK